MFDFQASVIPQMTPLQKSYTNNSFEREIKELFIDLFKTHLGEATFNAFVLGSPHLGSFDLVRKVSIQMVFHCCKVMLKKPRPDICIAPGNRGTFKSAASISCGFM